ncbi:hypothetical protein DM860_008853 [Cuscuta australis]|uniref:Acetyltransferase n=1 Tax=Cuscuta australis TaxID=267555 RepID=A0A328DBI5_9ASTE|nr:hypothetical protein DM860_008853 [Cuscuta australis]
MAETEVISTCLVGAAAAASETSNTVSRVDLTPWDLQFLHIGPIQKGLLFRIPSSAAPGFIPHLKTSLSSALAFYPPLAGRFAALPNPVDGTTSLFVDCNNAGVEFVEAKAAGVTVAAVLDPSNNNVPGIVRSFFTLNGIRNVHGISKPLMGVQVTELHDGYFIGCTLNHTLADGTSFWNFFRSWSELSRGLPHLSTPPVLDRWFPDNFPRPVPLPGEISFLGNLPPSLLPERVFHLSKESIAKLKEKANSEMGMPQNSISSLQAYTAHVWRSLTRARRLDLDEDVRVIMGVGTRARVPLPEGYWGNGAYMVKVTAKAGEVLNRGLGWTAWQLKEAVAKQSSEEVERHYRNWVRSSDLFGEGELLSANALVMSSSPRFDVYGTDFGWGKPVAVRSGAANKPDGKVTLYGGEEQGSVDIEMCIDGRTLERLGDYLP